MSTREPASRRRRSVPPVAAVLVVSTAVAGCLAGDLSREMGGRCASDDECEGSLRCVFGRCRPECTFDRDCPDGASCVASPDDPSLRVCTLSDETGCRDDEDCPDPLVCDLETGLCRNECVESQDPAHHLEQCGPGRYCLDGVCVEIPPGWPEDLREWPLWYADGDGDGYGDAARGVLAWEAPEGYVADESDCDDGDPEVHPGAPERCNGLDDDCDDQIDEEPTDGLPWYLDADEDGFGSSASEVSACEAPEGYVADGGDCDDGDPEVHPEAAERCNGMDDDCDDVVDEGEADDLCPPGLAVLETDCQDGVCVIVSCQPSSGDCDREWDSGCETSLTTETDCGECGNDCGESEVCEGGSCVPVAGGEWIEPVGGPRAEDCGAVLAAGGVVVAGCRVQSGSGCGGETVPSALGFDICVVAYEPGGGERWHHVAAGSGGGDEVGGLAADSGTVVAVGQFEGDLVLPGATLTGEGVRDVFACSFDLAGGTLLHATSFGGIGQDYGRGVVIDAAGHWVVAAGLDGDVLLGGHSYASVDMRDIYILVLDGTGRYLSHLPYGGLGHDDVYSVARGPGGVLALGGQFHQDLTFDAYGLTATRPSFDAFVAVLDGGTASWARDFGARSDDAVAAVVVDPSGEVVVAGWFGGTVDLGGGDRLAEGGVDAFVARYAADGAWLWDRTFGDGGTDEVRSLALGPSGEVYAAGRFEGTVDFGRGGHTSFGGEDAFVARFDASGDCTWDWTAGDRSDDAVLAVDLEAGYLVMAGTFGGTLTDPTGALPSIDAVAAPDGFVARLRPLP